MPGLSRKTVVITGASRGLGRALVLAFAEGGWKVSACARSAASLSELAEELERSAVPHLCEGVDVSNESEVRSWIERTQATLGHPAVLINNASLLGSRQPLLSIASQEWTEVLAANLNGTVLVTRLVAEAMLAVGEGSIINVSSGAAIAPRVTWGTYAISKAAVEAFSYNLAAELEGTGVRVNVVDPGAMRTAMRAEAYPREDPQTLKEPGATAPLFLWLAGDESRAVTGERFQADEWRRGQRTGAL